MLAVNRACQITEEPFQKQHVRALNKLICRIKDSADMILKYRTLEMRSLHLRVYSDASFAWNKDKSSQLGYTIMLADSRGTCHILS